MLPTNQDKRQSQAFIEAAKATGADEDEKAREACLNAVAKPSTKKASRKSNG